MSSNKRKAKKSFAHDMSHSNRQLKIEDVCVGLIVRLPSKQSLSDSELKCVSSTCCGKMLANEGYDHPMLVVRDKTAGPCPIVTVTQVGTFGNTSMQDYIAQRGNHCLNRRKFRPIFHDKSNPSVEQFRLVGDRRMSKQSYIHYQHMYDVPLSQLHIWTVETKERTHYQFLRLEEPSYHHLMESMGLHSQGYEKHSLIREIASQSVLASTVVSETTVEQSPNSSVEGVVAKDDPERSQPFLEMWLQGHQTRNYGAIQPGVTDSRPQQPEVPEYITEPSISKRGWGEYLWSRTVINLNLWRSERRHSEYFTNDSPLIQPWLRSALFRTEKWLLLCSIVICILWAIKIAVTMLITAIVSFIVAQWRYLLAFINQIYR